MAAVGFFWAEYRLVACRLVLRIVYRIFALKAIILPGEVMARFFLAA
jgi:hypothetical protein